MSPISLGEAYDSKRKFLDEVGRSDEMNIHVPQSIIATSEAATIMKAENHIVTPQRNGPVNGMVQDGLVGPYILTNTWNDGTVTMVKVADAMNCYTMCDIDVGNLLERAYEYYPEFISEKKGNYFFSTDEIPGKLFVSALFPEYFSFSKTTNTNPNFPKVEITNGVLHQDSGPLCKSVIGSKANSIVHILWIEWSPRHSLKFLSDTQKLVDAWLPLHGFSMGISDCLITSTHEVGKIITEMDAKVRNILTKCNNGVPNYQEEIEINNILNSAMNVGQRLANEKMNKGDRNALNITRMSGAKGSIVNLVQITAFVGQQNVDGKRIQSTISDNTRTLSCFDFNDYSAEARGFIKSNYIKGLNPYETFFHAVGGRVGLISTALKTADTGYAQKRSSAFLQEFKVYIDGSVRDANSRVIQFLYGGDGKDPKKLYYNKSLDYPFFVNPLSVAARLNSATRSGTKKSGKPRKLSHLEIEDIVSSLHLGMSGYITPVNITAEQNDKDILRELLRDVSIKPSAIPKFKDEIIRFYDTSKAEYGEMVGLIAATSIGEPTTQMTLNTFHLAGYKGKDVSLGVWRYEELLSLTRSDKQKNPSCFIYFESDVLENEETKIDKLRKLEKISISFEELYVKNIVEEAKMMYIGKSEMSAKSPVDPNTYEKYKETWWAKLYKKVFGGPEFDIKSWVIRLKFDMNKLYKRDLTVKEVAKIISDGSEGGYFCIPSPECIGEIEIYLNYNEITSFVRTSVEMFEEEDTLLTEDNVDFFTCRMAMTSYISDIKISGIKGVKKTYPREDGGTWMVDLALTSVPLISSVKRFLDVMMVEGVDKTKTFTDDVHTIYAIFGIDAARKFLIDEIKRIISFDGTYVNIRHFQLLVDGMTNSGNIVSVRRHGISRDVGPIAKLMFEQTISNAIHSSVFGECDNMNSLSSAVMYGTMAKAGSGMASVTYTGDEPISLNRVKRRLKK